MKEIFRNFIEAVKAGTGRVSVEGSGSVAAPDDDYYYTPQTGSVDGVDVERPKHNQIMRKPLLAEEDGKLVMVVDHTFYNIPSWVEWDPETYTLSIAEMNGTVNEVQISLDKDHLSKLVAARKILLVSNEPDKGPDDKVIHYVPFLPRNA